MSEVSDVIAAALRERRRLPPSERHEYPVPDELRESPRAMIRWTIGVTLQDAPALIILAATSVIYMAWTGAKTIVSLVVG